MKCRNQSLLARPSPDPDEPEPRSRVQRAATPEPRPSQIPAGFVQVLKDWARVRDAISRYG